MLLRKLLTALHALKRPDFFVHSRHMLGKVILSGKSIMAQDTLPVSLLLLTDLAALGNYNALLGGLQSPNGSYSAPSGQITAYRGDGQISWGLYECGARCRIDRSASSYNCGQGLCRRLWLGNGVG